MGLFSTILTPQRHREGAGQASSPIVFMHACLRGVSLILFQPWATLARFASNDPQGAAPHSSPTKHVASQASVMLMSLSGLQSCRLRQRAYLTLLDTSRAAGTAAYDMEMTHMIRLNAALVNREDSRDVSSAGHVICSNCGCLDGCLSSD
jgi:hypothetical protein